MRQGIFIVMVASLDQGLDGIEWTVPNIFRLVALAAAALAILNFAVMLSHYWWRVIPLRKEIADGDVVAPPVFWSFSYHVTVMMIAAYLFIGQYIALARDFPTSVLTYVTPFLLVVLNVIVRKFSNGYSAALDSAAWKKRLASLDAAQCEQKE